MLYVLQQFLMSYLTVPMDQMFSELLTQVSEWMKLDKVSAVRFIELNSIYLVKSRYLTAKDLQAAFEKVKVGHQCFLQGLLRRSFNWKMQTFSHVKPDLSDHLTVDVKINESPLSLNFNPSLGFSRDELQVFLQEKLDILSFMQKERKAYGENSTMLNASMTKNLVAEDTIKREVTAPTLSFDIQDEEEEEDKETEDEGYFIGSPKTEFLAQSGVVEVSDYSSSGELSPASHASRHLWETASISSRRSSRRGNASVRSSSVSSMASSASAQFRHKKKTSQKPRSSRSPTPSDNRSYFTSWY
jgi:hypothetical protein